MSDSIYSDIAKRTGGGIYVGVVGPQRCGKSTFIKKFMESAVIPNIKDENELKRAVDELPQSAGGKTVMTTEPKFVPENAVSIDVGAVSLKVKMVDCVGYGVEGAEGAFEDGKMREVMTPWSEKPMPFDEAAELGTKKVICDHSTVAVLVTCDGSFGDIPRENFVSAEERVVSELKAASKPFVTVLNCKDPENENSEKLGMMLEEKYNAPVALVNCTEIDMADIENILGMLVFEFPISEAEYIMPDWVSALDFASPIYRAVVKSALASAGKLSKLSDAARIDETSDVGGYEVTLETEKISLGDGRAVIGVSLDDGLFYSAIGDATGYGVKNRADIMRKLCETAKIAEEYEKYASAIADVERCGYGIVMPSVSDMELCEPEIVKREGSYGVRLRAGATSVHLIKTKIETEISPIVGTEKQSEELVGHLLEDFENDSSLIWDSNIFGKSLYELVKDGLHAKLLNMPEDSRGKIADTLSRIINEGSQGLICIIL